MIFGPVASGCPTDRAVGDYAILVPH